MAKKIKWTAQQLVALDEYKTKVLDAHRAELARQTNESYTQGYHDGQEALRLALRDLLGIGETKHGE